jgi:hypothetical protein
MFKMGQIVRPITERTGEFAVRIVKLCQPEVGIIFSFEKAG